MPPKVYIYYNGANLSVYRAALESAGAIPLFSTNLSIADRCDGLLLPEEATSTRPGMARCLWKA